MSGNCNQILSKVERFMYEKGKQNCLVKILARDDEGLAKNYVKGCANNDLVIPLTDATGLRKHVRKLYLIIIAESFSSYNKHYCDLITDCAKYYFSLGLNIDLLL